DAHAAADRDTEVLRGGLQLRHEAGFGAGLEAETLDVCEEVADEAEALQVDQGGEVATIEEAAEGIGDAGSAGGGGVVAIDADAELIVEDGRACDERDAACCGVVRDRVDGEGDLVAIVEGVAIAIAIAAGGEDEVVGGVGGAGVVELLAGEVDLDGVEVAAD